jgi:hypothetical protein
MTDETTQQTPDDGDDETPEEFREEVESDFAENPPDGELKDLKGG